MMATTAAPASVPVTPPPATRARRATWAVFLLFAVVLLRPVLTPAQVEGFSASIVSLGLHIAHGRVGAYDQVFPANLEFFGLSRLGAALAVALFAKLGLGGEWAMRLVMWVGLVVLAVSSWSLVRRWTHAGGLAAAAALLVMPGPAESGFFYNDNVLSAALAVAALALLARSRHTAVALAAGLLFGLGVVTRTDAVLLGPAALFILWDQEGTGRGLFVRGLAMAVGALVPLVGLYGAFHATIFDVLHISRYAVWMWARGLDVRRHIQEALLFVGIPGAVLLVLGLVALVRRRDARGLVLLVGVPLLFNLVTAGKLWQARQLLPLTPLLAALVVYGWQFLTDAARGAARAAPAARAGLVAFVALTAVVFAAPVPVWSVVYSDGPHAWIGRLRGTRLWTRWQYAVNTDMARIAQLAVDAGAHATAAHPAVLVTDLWNQDRYVHLSLQEAGYTVAPAGDVPPACVKTAELFRRGNHAVLHVRLHEPFLQAEAALLGRRLGAYGVPCFAAVGVADPVLVTTSWRLRDLFAGGPTPALVLPGDTSRTFRGAWYDPTEAVALTPDRLATLDHLYAGESARFLRWATAVPSARRGSALPEAEHIMAAQVAFPDGRPPAAGGAR